MKGGKEKKQRKEENIDNNEFNVIGKLIIDFKNLENFYRSFQIKKNNRKKVKTVELDFIYNLTQYKVNFDNARVDDLSNLNLEKYINEFNLSKNRIFNKITFKNFVSKFFDAYAG